MHSIATQSRLPFDWFGDTFEPPAQFGDTFEPPAQFGDTFKPPAQFGDILNRLHDFFAELSSLGWVGIGSAPAQEQNYTGIKNCSLRAYHLSKTTQALKADSCAPFT